MCPRLKLAVVLTAVSVPVRRYVEGMKEASKLLDLLSTAGSDELEPTKAVAARQVLYPDVSIFHTVEFCPLSTQDSTCHRQPY